MKLGPKLEKFGGGWSRKVEIDGVEYHVVHSRGRSVRIPYKPRGQNRGWIWHGAVYRDGKLLWADKVQKSSGARGMLIDAGVLKGKSDETSVA